MSAPVRGTCDETFAKVRDVFERSFESGEIGAGVAVLIDGEPVIDLWGGWTDEERTRPWERDTIVNVYSVTKGMASVCMNRLIEQGLLDLDAPVAKYWPEFAQNGKQDITMRLLISHQAGLPTAPRLPRNVANDWTAVTTALAEAAPEWEPGSQQVYHWVTWGYLNGEVLRRIDGRTIGTYLREEVCGPLGADFLLGVGPEHDARCATLVQGQVVTPLDAAPGLSPEERAEDNAMWGPNSRNWRAAEVPSANGHATAMGVARVYGALARGGELDGVRILRPDTIDRATVQIGPGMQPMMAGGSPLRFATGFMLYTRALPNGGSVATFGHGGIGGAFGLADRERKLAFSYVMNKLNSGFRTRLEAAVYECLE
ncbi:MAG TPA: serine hydrolase domain-containing protein [Candidatus Limnocylindria bacterium]